MHADNLQDILDPFETHNTSEREEVIFGDAYTYLIAKRTIDQVHLTDKSKSCAILCVHPDSYTQSDAHCLKQDILKHLEITLTSQDHRVVRVNYDDYDGFDIFKNREVLDALSRFRWPVILVSAKGLDTLLSDWRTERPISDVFDAIIRVRPAAPREVMDLMERAYGTTPSVAVVRTVLSSPLSAVGEAFGNKSGGLEDGLLRLRRAVATKEIARKVEADAKAEKSAAVKKSVSVASTDRGADVLPLSQMPGVDARARDWGMTLARDIADIRSGVIGYDDLDRGVLLSGAPGTGKTTYAKALARECGVEIIDINLTETWGSRKLGGGLSGFIREIEDLFDKAREYAATDHACIVFIDEIDSLGRRDKFSGHNASINTETMTYMLSKLDGYDRHNGVIIVGATNYPQNLDPALLRPGRLDRHIDLQLPDDAGRAEILHFYLPSIPVGDLIQTSSATFGMAGAGLEQIARDARRSARLAHREVSMDDVLGALLPQRPISARDTHSTAVHEIGHVLAGHLEGYVIKEVRLALDGPLSLVAGYTEIWRGEDLVRTRADIMREVRAKLGGMAAEALVLGHRLEQPGLPSGDAVTATTQIARMILSSSLDAMLSSVIIDDDQIQGILIARGDIRRRVEEIMQSEWIAVLDALRPHKTAIERMAAVLIVRKVLGRDEIAQMIREVL
jgi:hypothetical protein